jgi:plasmid replication initiation protein
MTCIYAFRLYELLMQWQGTGKREVELDWLKQQLELDESYDRMFDLKKRVIDPAINDINANSNFNVSWTQRKAGRSISHLIFEFSEKKPLAPEKPKRKTKAKAEPVKLENLDHFAEMRKRFGDAIPAGAIPPEIIEQLKTQGRW